MTRLLAAMLLFLALCGCETVPTPRATSMVTLLPEREVVPDKVKEVVVDARTMWMSTGVFLHQGDIVRVTAEGTWFNYPGSVKSPEGGPQRMPWGSRVLLTAPLAALVGRIGQNSPFLLGLSRTFEANADGNLELTCNDVPGWFDDNTGQVRVRIAVQNAPKSVLPTSHLQTAPHPHRVSATRIAQHWAVVIGISDYKYSGGLISDLRYADRDASEFAAWLLDPDGGGFERDHVLTLTGQKATYNEVNYALKDFPKKTVKEDVVVVFFSGHGLPDPEKPDNLYLCCYDTRPDRMASTAISMSLLNAAIRENIGAERVLIFADACHAGELGVKGVRVGNTINDGLTDRDLFAGRPGKLVFTSSEAREASRESDRWGGGHGIFTWSLLQGLTGKADGFGSQTEDGTVQLGELLDYVDQTVRRETGNSQHPQRVGRFDRNMPMGVAR